MVTLPAVPYLPHPLTYSLLTHGKGKPFKGVTSDNSSPSGSASSSESYSLRGGASSLLLRVLLGNLSIILEPPEATPPPHNDMTSNSDSGQHRQPSNSNLKLAVMIIKLMASQQCYEDAMDNSDDQGDSRKGGGGEENKVIGGAAEKSVHIGTTPNRWISRMVPILSDMILRKTVATKSNALLRFTRVMERDIIHATYPSLTNDHSTPSTGECPVQVNNDSNNNTKVNSNSKMAPGNIPIAIPRRSPTLNELMALLNSLQQQRDQIEETFVTQQNQSSQPSNKEGQRTIDSHGLGANNGGSMTRENDKEGILGIRDRPIDSTIDTDEPLSQELTKRRRLNDEVVFTPTGTTSANERYFYNPMRMKNTLNTLVQGYLRCWRQGNGSSLPTKSSSSPPIHALPCPSILRSLASVPILTPLVTHLLNTVIDVAGAALSRTLFLQLKNKNQNARSSRSVTSSLPSFPVISLLPLSCPTPTALPQSYILDAYSAASTSLHVILSQTYKRILTGMLPDCHPSLQTSTTDTSINHPTTDAGTDIQEGSAGITCYTSKSSEQVSLLIASACINNYLAVSRAATIPVAGATTTSSTDTDAQVDSPAKMPSYPLITLLPHLIKLSSRSCASLSTSVAPSSLNDTLAIETSNPSTSPAQSQPTTSTSSSQSTSPLSSAPTHHLHTTLPSSPSRRLSPLSPLTSVLYDPCAFDLILDNILSIANQLPSHAAGAPSTSSSPPPPPSCPSTTSLSSSVTRPFFPTLSPSNQSFWASYVYQQLVNPESHPTYANTSPSSSSSTDEPTPPPPPQSLLSRDVLSVSVCADHSLLLLWAMLDTLKDSQTGTLQPLDPSHPNELKHVDVQEGEGPLLVACELADVLLAYSLQSIGVLIKHYIDVSTANLSLWFEHRRKEQLASARHPLKASTDQQTTNLPKHESLPSNTPPTRPTGGLYRRQPQPHHPSIPPSSTSATQYSQSIRSSLSSPPPSPAHFFYPVLFPQTLTSNAPPLLQLSPLMPMATTLPSLSRCVLDTFTYLERAKSMVCSCSTFTHLTLLTLQSSMSHATPYPSTTSSTPTSPSSPTSSAPPSSLFNHSNDSLSPQERCIHRWRQHLPHCPCHAFPTIIPMTISSTSLSASPATPSSTCFALLLPGRSAISNQTASSQLVRLLQILSREKVRDNAATDNHFTDLSRSSPEYPRLLELLEDLILDRAYSRCLVKATAPITTPQPVPHQASTSQTLTGTNSEHDGFSPRFPQATPINKQRLDPFAAIDDQLQLMCSPPQRFTTPQHPSSPLSTTTSCQRFDQKVNLDHPTHRSPFGRMEAVLADFATPSLSHLVGNPSLHSTSHTSPPATTIPIRDWTHLGEMHASPTLSSLRERDTTQSNCRPLHSLRTISKRIKEMAGILVSAFSYQVLEAVIGSWYQDGAIITPQGSSATADSTPTNQMSGLINVPSLGGDGESLLVRETRWNIIKWAVLKKRFEATKDTSKSIDNLALELLTMTQDEGVKPTTNDITLGLSGSIESTGNSRSDPLAMSMPHGINRILTCQPMEQFINDISQPVTRVDIKHLTVDDIINALSSLGCVVPISGNLESYAL